MSKSSPGSCILLTTCAAVLCPFQPALLQPGATFSSPAHSPLALPSCFGSWTLELQLP